MINGVYQTDPKIGKFHKFPSGIIAYEGVINRIFKDKLIKQLKIKEIPYIDICPTEEDISLENRVKEINKACQMYGKHNCLLLSQHSNAGGGTGFEIFTTRGKTKSDEYAEILAEILIKKFPYIKFRSDKTDNDLDKEADFYIIKKSLCPAILIECLFFDNWSDYLMLYNSLFQVKYIQALMDFIQKVKV